MSRDHVSPRQGSLHRGPKGPIRILNTVCVYPGPSGHWTGPFRLLERIASLLHNLLYVAFLVTCRIVPCRSLYRAKLSLITGDFDVPLKVRTLNQRGIRPSELMFIAKDLSVPPRTQLLIY